VAKKKSRKRGWSGAPPARPSGGSRTPTRPVAGSSRPAGAVTTEDQVESPPAAESSPAPRSTPAPRQAARSTPAARQAPQPTSNRTVRKEEARRQRETLRRKAARRRTMRRTGIIAGSMVGVVAVVALIVLTHKGPVPFNEIDPHTLPGVTADQAPWPAETAQLSNRIHKMGLPPLGGEQLAYHIHQNLVIYVNGTQEPVPFGLGLIPPRSFAEIHTHDNSGTIHVEAGATRRFTLGTVFDVWGVLFTKDQIGAYKNHGDTRIRVFSNGKPVTGDPTQLPLRDHQVIVVTYGTPAQVPKQIPSVFHYAQAPTVPKASATPTASSQASAAATPSASPS
jgi:hypothetical protein